MDSKVDAWGRVTVGFDDLAEALYNGLKLSDLLVEPSAAAERFNARCAEKDRSEHTLVLPEEMTITPEDEHARRAAHWLVCEDLQDLDVREFVLSLCDNDAERDRVNEEMDLFEARGLEPLLRTMICLVGHFRSNNVLWGVGRGSSVASYVLYRIGVHRIDPLKYGLDVREFLKD